MKVTYKFEIEDIKVGKYFTRNSYRERSEPSGMASVTYKVGYFSWRPKGQRYCLISISDGMVLGGKTKEQICAFMNSDRIGFRPTDREDLLAMVYYLHGVHFE